MVDDVFGFDTPDLTPVESIKAELPSGEVVEVDEKSQAYSVAKTLAEKIAAVAAIDAKQADAKARMADMREQMAELQKQKDVIAQALRELDNEMFDDNRAKRELQNEIFRLRRLLAQAIDAEMATKKFLENAHAFAKTMEAQPYADRILQHQRDGAYIIATNMRTILGDKRGAGKTLTSIAAWDMAQSQRVLVVVPDDVVSNFVNEIHYWAPHRNVMQLGKMPPAQRQYAISLMRQMEAFTAVINYSAWRKDKTLIEDIISLKFDTVVMDEAHEMKNTGTSAYRGCRDIVLAENTCPKCTVGTPIMKATVDGWDSVLTCENCGWTALDKSYEFLDRCSVKMVIPMSGTVILNKPQDLFALLSLVDPINFRELKDYLRVYCQQNFYTGKWEFKSGGLESLQKKLAGKYIAREGVKTPGQTVYDHTLELDPNEYPGQHKVITQISQHAQLMLEQDKKANILHTIALITRKRQANVWPAGIVMKDEEGNVVIDVGESVRESIKLDKCISERRNDEGEFDGLIPEFTEQGDKMLGARVIVFSQFKGPLAELERRLNNAGISVVRFDGDTPQHIRDAAKIDFDRKYCDTQEYKDANDGYKWQVLLANYKTGGVGLNFTAATETIVLDREWNPGKEDQAAGRTDRLGQTEHTNLHVLRIANTIDVWMDALIDEKADLIGGFNKVGESLTDRLLKAMRDGEVM
jgi:SNF2 family DNA or RNA helicase